MFTYPQETINDRLTRFTGPTGEMVYLAEGSREAAVIDTGYGLVGLREQIEEQLRGKPYCVLLTHGHPDHALGASAFDVPVYLAEADWPLYQTMCTQDAGAGMIRNSPQYRGPAFTSADFVTLRPIAFRPLMEGMRFELGGLTVEALALPGHTGGSMCFLFREDRALLTGDACNPFTFLFDEYALSVSDYREVLAAFDRRTRGRYDKVYLSHGADVLPPALVTDAISVCDDILARRVDDMPFMFMGQPAVIAKAVNFERFCREDGGLANIVYSKEKNGIL